MSPESEQTAPKAPGSKPRAGVPSWRTGKPDAVLAAAVDVARAAVETIAPAGQIGRHLAARSEGDRLVTHLFESKLAGYGGWQWYAVLTRNSRSKVVTVDELGLLPSEDSILAPEWVPWAERVRPEDAQDEEPVEAAPADAAAAEVAAGPDDVEVHGPDDVGIGAAADAEETAGADEAADAGEYDAEESAEAGEYDDGTGADVQPERPAEEAD